MKQFSIQPPIDIFFHNCCFMLSCFPTDDGDGDGDGDDDGDDDDNDGDDDDNDGDDDDDDGDGDGDDDDDVSDGDDDDDGDSDGDGDDEEDDEDDFGCCLATFWFGTFVILLTPRGMLLVMRTLEDEWYDDVEANLFTVFALSYTRTACLHYPYI